MKKEKPIYKISLFIIVSIIVIAGVLYWGISIWNKYKNNIINLQKEQMQLTVESIADNLNTTLNSYANNLIRASELLIDDSQYEDGETLTHTLEVLSMSVDDPYIENIILLDLDHNVQWEMESFCVSEIYSTSYLMDYDVEMSEVMNDDGSIYFVLQKEMENVGTLQLVINVNEYYNVLLSDKRLGNNGYIIVKSSEGILFMHPDQKQLGKSVIEGRQSLYPDLDYSDLIELVKHQNENESGIEEYYSYWWPSEDLIEVKKICAYTRVNLRDDYLIVTADIDYADVYEPVSSSFVSILIMFCIIFFIVVGILIFTVHTLFQRRKYIEELEYLKNLNAILEKTNQKEEHIAHQQRLQIIGTMTGGIAHEFNNLLTPIMGYAELLEDTFKKESDEYDNVQEIINASEKAKNVIRQISGLSRKNMETVFEFINCKQFMTRTIKMMHSICPVSIQITLDIALENEGVLGNANQLNQVILNLCVNAIHAIGEKKNGKIKISCFIEQRKNIVGRTKEDISTEWNQYICIEIEDNGCGMDKSVIGKMFDPFFTTKANGEGTGLGLSIVDQIVHSHKGVIVVDSVPKKGTKFYVYMPLVEQSDITIESSTQQEKQSPIKMLVVDDNAKILRLLERHLKQKMMEVTTVSNTSAAREKLKKCTYDVILIDQELSTNSNDDSGICFAMSVNGLYPDMFRIIMTNQIRKEIIEAKKRGIIDAYLEKPVSDTEIIETIRNCSQKEKLSI